METKGIELTISGDGCRLRLRVAPGARRDRIVGPHGAALKLSVTSPPERGEANEAIVRLLAATLDLPVSQIRLVAGLRGKDKIAQIDRLSPDDLRRRLELLGDPTADSSGKPVTDRRS